MIHKEPLKRVRLSTGSRLDLGLGRDCDQLSSGSINGKKRRCGVEPDRACCWERISMAAARSKKDRSVKDMLTRPTMGKVEADFSTPGKPGHVVIEEEGVGPITRAFLRADLHR
ncbi:hypothetical protein NDU88_006872 [Pleurodeles waltl]|uniref:Uncharacterized protein n=1 Tax=Pleurodeles waltl TaxID=8319 RepID=A0AAV7TY29_PLEWA|nr:hypothetical protein NDU88_006872 [Pleurodeles waltl]